jgi:hypothetical protein
MLLLLAAAPLSAQWSANPDALGMGLTVGMTIGQVDSVAAAAGWRTVSKSAKRRQFRDSEPAFSSSLTVGFRSGIVSTVTIESVFVKGSSAAGLQSIAQAMRQGMIERAERTEGNAKAPVYVSTSNDGSTIRARWIDRGTRGFRTESKVSPAR